MQVPKKWLMIVRWGALECGALSVALVIANTNLNIYSLAVAIPYVLFFVIARKLDAKLTILVASAMILLGFGSWVLLLTSGDDKTATGYYYITFVQLGLAAWLWSQKSAPKS